MMGGYREFYIEGFRFVRFIPLFLLFFIALPCANSAAADARSFFGSRDGKLVRNVFTRRSHDLEEPVTLEYFPSQQNEGLLEEEEQDTREGSLVEEEAEYEEASLEEEAEAEEEEEQDPRAAPKDKADVIDRFGDPDERMAVMAQGDAPKPFQGLQAALELGDEELALKYARKYVRYMHDIQARGKEVSTYLRKANVAEKISDYDEEGDVTKEEVDAYEEHVEEQVRLHGPDVLLDTNESKLFHDLQSSDRLAQEQAQQDLDALVKTGKVPVDSSGRVDVYYFFDLSDENSLQMGKEIQRLFRSSESNPNLNLIGFTMSDSINAEALDGYRRATGAKFPVNPGGVLAKGFKVTAAPTTLLVTPSDGKSYSQEGAVTGAFLKALVTYMQGGSAR